MIGFRSKSAKPDLPDRLEALEAALAIADGRLDPEAIGYARHVIDKAADRLRHGTTHTLVALLGATGAGKSSIANQLIGSDIATTGVRRPTTSSTMAAYWGSDDPNQLLDWLEVSSRHGVADQSTELDGLILLDVPDHDSVTLEHRLEMERIAEYTDLMVWVTDPEKYADASLHDYLKQLSSHHGVTLMVLNKADRLSESELATCRNDLARLMVADGLEKSRVVATSAFTGHGIAELKSVLAKTVAEKRVITERLAADVSLAANELAAGAPTVSTAKISDSDEKRLSDNLVASAGIDAVADAVAAGHRRDAAAAVGWPVTRWAGKLRSHPLNRMHLGRSNTGRSDAPGIGGANEKRAIASIRNLADRATRGLEDPWPGLVRAAGTPPTKELRDQIDRAVSGSVRARTSRKPRWWSVVRLLQNLLAIVMVAGLLWLAAAFAVAWFQLPPLPAPKYRDLPLPTIAAIGGAALGILIAFLGRMLARVGARRQANRVRTDASKAVRGVTKELVVEPMRRELDQRNELYDLLERAA